MKLTSPSSTRPPRATCRTCWRCRTVRPWLGAHEPDEGGCVYRLAGPTCLAGDVIGDYAFDAPLKEGDEVVFGDMALYTMVKTNTFNGMPLPAIARRAADGTVSVVRSFGYEDFKSRL